jgi:hypothetical protein
VGRDNVPEEVKQQRLKEVIQTFFATLAEKSREEIGRRHLVLVEGVHHSTTTINSTFILFYIFVLSFVFFFVFIDVCRPADVRPTILWAGRTTTRRWCSRT